jgi:FAD/FMN-containing dehydrogenase
MTDLSRRDFLGVGGGVLGLSAAAALGRRRPRTSARPAGNPLEELRSQLKGTLLTPGDAGFGPATAPANGRYRDVIPLAAALCADELDVVACVEWAKEHHVQPVGRTGGHSYAGFSTTTGLIVDMGLLNSVSIDRDDGTATVGGGALNGDLFRATNRGSLFLPAGTCLGVGVGGLTLGGGIGYNTHWQGLTCDHLRSTRMVIADGNLLDVDPSHDGDLFWACQGGAGGSFGLNTQFVFELAEMPAGNVSFYRFDWRGADAATAVLSTFDHLLATAPAALNAVAQAQAVPIGAGGPREAITVFSRGQYIGPSDELYDLVKPLIDAAGVPLTMTIEEMTFWEAQKMFASSEAEHEQHSFGDLGRYASKPLPQPVVAAMVDLLARCPSRSDGPYGPGGSLWSLGWIGGPVVNAKHRTQTAYVHRDMHTMWRPTPVWPDNASNAVQADLLDWTNAVICLLEKHTPRESYQNFPNRLITDWQQQYYAENYDRLAQVKAKYDRHNLFRNEQSIR